MPAYKNKNGTWFVKYQVTDIRTGARKAAVKRGFATKREALDYEAEQRGEASGGSRATFDEILEEYLQSLDSSSTSAALKRSWINLHFPLHDVPIQKITRPSLIAWRNELKDKGLATRTMNRGLGYVKAVLNYAARVYGIPDNSVILNNYKLTKADKEEKEVWTPEEFRQFIDCVDQPHYKAYFTFLYWTGCRRSEGLAVCKEDFKGNTVHIWRSIKHYKNGFLPLKTDSSERTILVDKKTMTELKPFIENAEPFVFGTYRSLSITNVQREFSKAIKKSGVKAITIHDLRHSHATVLINAGVNIVAVSKRLGHSSINITLKTYAHLLNETEEELVSTIDELRANDTEIL